MSLDLSFRCSFTAKGWSIHRSGPFSLHSGRGDGPWSSGSNAFGPITELGIADIDWCVSDRCSIILCRHLPPSTKMYRGLFTAKATLINGLGQYGGGLLSSLTVINIELIASVLWKHRVDSASSPFLLSPFPSLWYFKSPQDLLHVPIASGSICST